MAEPERSLFVPLSSNAYALVDGATGESVESVRRRLKFASITFDQILLEGGVMEVNAGPGGLTVDRQGDPDAEFQTDEQRTAMEGGGFTVSIGAEDVPGVTATQMRQFIESESTISWSATLQPFARELPADCDWVDFANVTRDTVINKTASGWRRADERNRVLEDAIPVQFVRKMVLSSANTDLALGAHSCIAVMQDQLHRQVVETRFEDEDDAGWQASGFALPIHMPDVTRLDWETVARVRKNKHVSDFRKILRDIEAQAVDALSEQGVRDTVNRAFARYLSEAVPKMDGVGAMARDMAVDLAIGQMGNIATAALGPAVGIPVGVVMDAGPTAIEGAYNTIRGRKHRWISVYQQIQGATAEARD